MKNNSKTELVMILLSLIILFLPITSAFANTFLEGKTMHLYKGEIGEYCIYLQNTGEKDTVQIIKIFEGKGFIKNLDDIAEEFEVPVKTFSDSFPVCMEVKLPNDAEKGEKYEISYGITNLPSNDHGGMVSISPVLIRENFYITDRLDKRPVLLETYIILVFVGLMIFGIMGYRYSTRTKLKIQEI